MKKNVNDIINSLGGTGKLANLLGVNPSAVSNYRQKGFPARLHLKIAMLCEERSVQIGNDVLEGATVPKIIKTNPKEYLSGTSLSIVKHLSTDGFNLIDPPVLVSADKVLDRMGENLADRLFILSDQEGLRLCLRPDLTIPTCLYYLDRGFTGEKKLYSYFGKVFQLRLDNSSGPSEYSQAGLEYIGKQDQLAAEIEIFYKVESSLRREGLKSYHTFMGDVSLFSIFLDVMDLPDLWRKKLKAKYWNESDFKALLEDLSFNKSVDNELARRVFSLDRESATDLVRRSLGMSFEGTPVGRSVEEIMERLRQKGEEFSLQPLSKVTVNLIKDFLSISDKPFKALDRLRSISKNLDSSLLRQIDIAKERLEKIKELGVNLDKSKFSSEKGREVEYYTGFLFDFVNSQKGKSIHLGGGGRYDNLIRSMGSKTDIPAVGAAVNMENLEKALSLRSLQ
tara:strand:+ start:311 stop:1666 length:1356 start_codon:yes stop_codon:yes gene_type:complete